MEDEKLEFIEKPPEWQAKGVEPPPDLTQSEKGWTPGYRPPAAYFNWFFSGFYRCMKELQEKALWLYSVLITKAPIESPTLTGVPQAPTPPKETSTDQIATTAFVQNVIGAIDFSALQGHTKFVQNADLNTLLDDQAYICVGTLKNAPTPTTYCIVRAYDTDSTSNVVQVCYVPQADNTVRTFVRSAVGGSVFGEWREMSATTYVDSAELKLRVLIEENKFRNVALAYAMRKAVLELFIETFETVDDIDTNMGDGAAAIAKYYRPDVRIFEKNDTGAVTIYSTTKVVTSGNTRFWQFTCWEDIEGGAIEVAISRDNGTTWVLVPQDTLVALTNGEPVGVTMRVRVKLTGKLKFRNIAWGTKP